MLTREQQKQQIYLNIAREISTLSRGKRAQVGCIIVKDDRILSCGYNGTPSGFDNNCEDENGNTKPEVIHAEANAILKARNRDDLVGADLYLTLSPCFHCSKLIKQAGIRHVYFTELYKDNAEGLKVLGIPSTQINPNGISTYRERI